MRSYVHSLRFALEGLAHTWQTEKNFRLFTCLYVASLVLGAIFAPWNLVTLIFSGGIFLSFELLNTALERFTDAFDTHTKGQNDIHTIAIKRTKDIAAAASLICAIAWGLILVLTLVGMSIYLPFPG